MNPIDTGDSQVPASVYDHATVVADTGNTTLKTITALASPVSALVSGLMSWYGMSKQQDQANEALAYNKELNAQELKQNEEALSEKKSEFATNTNLSKKQLALNAKAQKFTESEAAKTWAWKEEDKNFERTKAVSDRLLNIFNSQPTLQANFLQQSQARKKNAYDFSALNPIRGIA